MVVNERNGPLVASFPIEDGDQIMLVTDAGKLIRTPIIDVRIASRNTQGVRVFRTDVNERVVSVERIPEEVAAEGEMGEDDGEAGPDAPETPGTEE
jgi:DNA gyrase subunit A